MIPVSSDSSFFPMTNVSDEISPVRVFVNKEEGKQAINKRDRDE